MVDRVRSALADADRDGAIMVVIDDLHELNCPEALAGVLADIEAFGLDLVEVRQLEQPTERQ